LTSSVINEDLTPTLTCINSKKSIRLCSCWTAVNQ